MAESRPVLFVHGLWMTGMESLLLRQRLGAYGLLLETFRYDTTSGRLADALAGLAKAIGALGPNARLLGHSLGGLVILRCLADHPTLEVGPVVLMGSPVNGCLAAEGIVRMPGGRWWLGEAAASELLMGPSPHWARATPVGVLSGDLPVGLGALVTDLATPHDGVVTVEETRLVGATAYRSFHVNHWGLLASAAVARAAAGFLNSGRFPD